MTAPRRTVGKVVRPVARTVGPPVRTSWDDVDESATPTVLGDLADVDGSGVGVLTRETTGAVAAFRAISHHHDQDAPSTFWLIAHGLPFTPAGVQVTGAGGQRIFPAGVFHTPGQTRIEFAYPVAGFADLS